MELIQLFLAFLLFLSAVGNVSVTSEATPSTVKITTIEATSSTYSAKIITTEATPSTDSAKITTTEATLSTDSAKTVTVSTTSETDPSKTTTVSNEEFTTDTTTQIPEDLLNLKLPDEFQARIRISRLSQSFKMRDVIVSYNLSTNKAATTVVDSKGKTRRIYDFDKKKIFVITDTSCSLENISNEFSEDPTFIFPFTSNNGIQKLKGPLSLFRLDLENTVEEEDQILVGGIPCREFQNSLNVTFQNECNETVECRLRHFYSETALKNFEGRREKIGSTPVRIDIECGNNTLRCDYHHSTIVFVNFHEKITSLEEFQQFPGVYCPGVEIADKSFPSLSSQVHIGIKEIVVTNKNFFESEIWYNKNLHLIRIDDTFIKNERNRRIKSVITDYKANMSYTITQQYSDGLKECKRNNVYEETEPSLLTLLIGAQNGEVIQAQKVGERYCGVYLCDVWTGNTNTKSTFDIYMRKIPSRDSNPVPEFANLFKTEGKLQQFSRRQVTKYSSLQGDWASFDITSCFKEKDLSYFSMTIEGEIEKNWLTPLFRESIFRNIWKFSNMSSVLRLQKLNIVRVTNETVEVEGAILHASTFKDVNQLYKDITAEKALQNLQMENGKTLFKFDGKNFEIKNFKIKEMDTTEKARKTYGQGEMAGLGIGMFVAGILCVAAIFFIYKKYIVKRHRKA